MVNSFFFINKLPYIYLVNFISSTLNPSRMAKKPKTHHSRWTPEQDVQFKNMVAGEFTSAQVANFFGRTLNSIYSRKIVLGLKDRLKRSTKDQVEGSVKKFTPKPARKPKPSLVLPPSPRPVKKEQVPVQMECPLPTLKKRGRPAKAKSIVPAKAPKQKINGFNSYSSKLAFVNQRRQRGDVKLLAEVCEMTPGFISRVLAGWYLSDVVMTMAFSLCENRQTNQEILQEIGFNRSKKKVN